MKLSISLLTGLTFCLLTCQTAVREQGQTLRQKEATAVKLADTTASAVQQDAPFQFQTPHPGEFRFVIGNPNAFPIEVTIENSNLSLAPNSWGTLAAVVAETGAAVDFDKGPILWGPAYRLPFRGGPFNTNILLISIDTLRHDAFSPQLMPNLYEIFAEQGAIFSNAYSPSPWTLPAHASMLTGELPAKHGIRTPAQKLSEDAVTLAEFFELSGFYNVAVTEGNYLSAQFGFDQGFHFYTERPPNMMARDAATLSKLKGNLEVLRQQIDSHKDGSPLFAFFHTYEVHCPYLPHDGLLDRNKIGMTQWLLDNELQGIDAKQMALLHHLYKGEVRYTDRTLGPYVKELLASGEWTVVLTSDHGEEFGEHGGILHADTLYDEVMRVPLAIAGVGVRASGTVTTRVSILDIVPTLLQLISGSPAPSHLPGRNLLDANLTDATLFAESYFLGPHIPGDNPRLGAVWNHTDKLIQKRVDDAFTAELYHLLEDPAERRNVVDEEQEKRDALYLFLEAYLEKGTTAPAVGDLSEEQLEVMRTLGYIK